MQMNWKKLAQIIVLLGVILIGKSASATIYYVDYSSGNDSNNGTTKSTPWQRAPGMTGCTGVCSSTTINPGDSVILKGGVTWPNAVLEWDWNFSGSSGNQIYVGVDTTWYNGSAWSRPVLNAGQATVTEQNDFLVIGGSYVTFDNFEMTGLLVGAYLYGHNSYINTQGSTYGDLKNIYIHGWENSIAGTDSGYAFSSDTHSPSYNVGMVIEQNVVDGSDTTEVKADPNCTGACHGTLFCYWSGPILRNNVCNNTSNGYIGGAQEFSGNLIENIRTSTGTNHENGFENNTDPCATGLLFFNNVIHNTTAVNIWIAPQSGSCAPSYAFNNVTYNTPQGNVWDVAYSLSTPGSGGTLYTFNNTIETGPDSNPSFSNLNCPTGFVACYYENNHLISNSSTAVISCTSNCHETNDLWETKGAANGYGYTAGQVNAFAPTSGSSPTVNKGTNVYGSLCSAIAAVLASAGTACESGTNSAVTYNTSNHTVTVPRVTPAPRPSSGAWDLGAYRYSSSSVTLPPPPTDLTATVQ
jgi:hypothetical protein